jgi:heme oxygenase
MQHILKKCAANGQLFPQKASTLQKKRMKLTDELKETTEAAHAAAEKKMVLALKRISTPEDYVSMLNWLYGFYAPLEDLVRSQLTEDNFPDMIKRSRAEYILWDIKEFNTEAQPPDICDHLPVIDSYARALGALYVLEGSTLGGRIIAGMISRQLTTTKGISYFIGYGAETGKMWQSLKDFLDLPRSPKENQEIIAAAEDTFINFKNWIDKHELQPQL